MQSFAIFFVAQTSTLQFASRHAQKYWFSRCHISVYASVQAQGVGNNLTRNVRCNMGIAKVVLYHFEMLGNLWHLN